MTNDQRQATAGLEKGPEYGTELVQRIFSVANARSVFSEPVTQGDYTVITASEIGAGGGFGFGQGSGQAPVEGADAGQVSSGGGGGGGGGGGAHARPVATIVIGPNGVKVEPIVDVTKLMLGAVSAWIAIAMMLARGRRFRLFR